MRRHPNPERISEPSRPSAFGEFIRHLDPPPHRPLVSDPALSALRRCGTEHVYVDSGRVEEVEDVCRRTSRGRLEGHAVVEEIDGMTVNQPLALEALEHMPRKEPHPWAEELLSTGLQGRALAHAAYHSMLLHIGAEARHAVSAGRDFETSLQVHMELVSDPRAATDAAEQLHRYLPAALIKIPFLPEAPQSLLLARDLIARGIPVNLTSTFSARQVAVAAILLEVTRTNVFAGRLSSGLHGVGLGERVARHAQRHLLEARRLGLTSTRLIVASIHGSDSMVRTAGCDVMTAPPASIRDFRDEADDDWVRGLEPALEAFHDEPLKTSEAVMKRLNPDRLERLTVVEPELLEFLREYRASQEFQTLVDGDRLFERFDKAGFGDLFARPSEADDRELRRQKTPDLDADLVDRYPLDTLYTLHANADFRRHQEEIDARLG